MNAVEVKTLDGSETALKSEAVDELEARVDGRLITPEHADYESARRVWNGMIDRHPALIVRCRGVADVIASVRFAGEHRLPLALRGGGHNVAGFGTCDGGLVIDLGAMRDVRVDPERRLARAGGGATWGDLDRETQLFGLAAPGGIVSTTGVAGLTLGGGQGWLRRTYGMTCDSLVSADVVTADGELLIASETENGDLFWALRGGGGNFGVVTSFEFRLHPVGPLVAFAGPTYAVESAGPAIARLREVAADAPDEVNLTATWWTIPAAPDFPQELHGRAVVSLEGMYVGPPAAGEQLLQPLREVEQPLIDLSETLPYTALQQLFDPFFPAGDLHYYWKSIYLAGVEDEAVRTINASVAARPSPMSMVALWPLGGALDKVDASATAIGARNAPFLVEILADWADPDESDANVAWAQELVAALEPFGTGRTNLNFPGLGDEPDFVRAGFGPSWDRLVEVKRTYDPSNLFRLNQNVDPNGTG